MSNFTFLKSEWPELHDAASKAESLAYPDPRTACFYARRALELAVFWLYKSDSALKLPYQEHLSALIHEPTFRTTVGPAVFAILGGVAIFFYPLTEAHVKTIEQDLAVRKGSAAAAGAAPA